MDNFDLKKFLVENRLTRNSQQLSIKEEDGKTRYFEVMRDNPQEDTVFQVEEIGPNATLLTVPVAEPVIVKSVGMGFDEVRQIMLDLGVEEVEEGEYYASDDAVDAVADKFGL